MKQHLLIVTFIATLFLPLVSFAAVAATYKPLVGIPGVDPAADFNSYINSLYALSISIAALLAVIKIIIAGVKWMMTDVVTSKGEAKKDIEGALIGLIIVIAAVLILNVINSDITDVDLKFESPVSPAASPAAAVPPTLDMSKVGSFSAGSYATVSYTSSTDPIQQTLFKQTCIETPYTASVSPQVDLQTLSGKFRCITYDHTKLNNVKILLSAYQPQCLAVSGATYTPDPFDSTQGYCAYPL